MSTRHAARRRKVPGIRVDVGREPKGSRGGACEHPARYPTPIRAALSRPDSPAAFSDDGTERRMRPNSVPDDRGGLHPSRVLVPFALHGRAVAGRLSRPARANEPGACLARRLHRTGGGPHGGKPWVLVEGYEPSPTPAARPSPCPGRARPAPPRRENGRGKIVDALRRARTGGRRGRCERGEHCPTGPGDWFSGSAAGGAEGRAGKGSPGAGRTTAACPVMLRRSVPGAPSGGHERKPCRNGSKPGPESFLEKKSVTGVASPGESRYIPTHTRRRCPGPPGRRADEASLDIA